MRRRRLRLSRWHAGVRSKREQKVSGWLGGEGWETCRRGGRTLDWGRVVMGSGAWKELSWQLSHSWPHRRKLR